MSAHRFEITTFKRLGRNIYLMRPIGGEFIRVEATQAKACLQSGTAVMIEEIT